MYRVKGFQEKEFTVEKSRFIARVYPVKDEEEIERIVKETWKEHRKATHVVTAYRLGEPSRGYYNDDGEPSQSAGAPMLMVLEKEELTDTLVVAIRYFGGIKLGVGGLIRAYTECAKEAIDGVEKRKVIEVKRVIFTYDYTYHGSIELLLPEIYREEPLYEEKVQQTVYLENDDLLQKLVEITSGKVEIQIDSNGYLEVSKTGTIVTGGSYERINR
ncbi:IMPACT family protein [Guggenheimella bovis]